VDQNTYGADVLHASIHRPSHIPMALDFSLLAVFCVALFCISLHNVKRRWIV
jgi:ABC-2 type transport system permease protein